MVIHAYWPNPKPDIVYLGLRMVLVRFHPSTEGEDIIESCNHTHPTPNSPFPLYPTKSWIFRTLEPLSGCNKIRVVYLLTERRDVFSQVNLLKVKRQSVLLDLSFSVTRKLFFFCFYFFFINANFVEWTCESLELPRTGIGIRVTADSLFSYTLFSPFH